MTTTKPTDHTKVVAELLAGRYDGHLVDISRAIVKRITDSTVRICWKLRLDDDEWTEDTVTAGELAFVEKLLSTERRPFSYMELNPRVSIQHRVALVVAHLHKVGGLKPSDAIVRAEALTQAEQRDLFDDYQVLDAPKDDPETPPSS